MPDRQPLPDTRRSITHKVRIETDQGSLSVYITASFYEDGRVAEVFINAGKIGSTVRGLLNDLARLTSFALQYGVPPDDLFQRMTGANYAPQGPTSNPEIEACSSISDYLFRWLWNVKQEQANRDDDGQ